MKLFFRRLGILRKRHERAVELITKLHITNPSDAHYDFLLMSGDSENKIRDVIRRAWKGNLAYSLIPIEPGKLSFWTGYFAKRDTRTYQHEPRRIPLRVKDGGLPILRSTASFWGEDRSLRNAWKRIISDIRKQAKANVKTSYNIVT
jgi:hypothetical protein